MAAAMKTWSLGQGPDEAERLMGNWKLEGMRGLNIGRLEMDALDSRRRIGEERS